MESRVPQSDRMQGPEVLAAPGDPIPVLGPLFSVLACGASSVVWLWFTSLKPNYFVNIAVSIPVLFFGAIGHLLLEELRATAAGYTWNRHVPLFRSRYYAFAVLFSAAAMISILFHVPVHARFALSRPAMNAFVADVQEYPDAIRPATMRVGSYVLQTAPQPRRDGALAFLMAGDNETGFTYSTTPIDHYPGGNPGIGGSLGGGWYWFSDD